MSKISVNQKSVAPVSRHTPPARSINDHVSSKLGPLGRHITVLCKHLIRSHHFVGLTLIVCYAQLRNSLKLDIPPFKSNIKKYSISYRGPVLWNHLPIECRNANSVKSFSRMINKLTLIRDIDFSNLYCRR